MVRRMRFTLRRLRAAPATSIGIILTLAIGLAAIAFIAALAYGVLLRPLPYPDPSRLVGIATLDRGGRPGGVSLPDVDDWRQQARSFQALGAAIEIDAALEMPGATVPLRIAAIEPDVFDALGAHATLGRMLTRDDDRTAAVVLSWRAWQRLSQATALAPGAAVRLNGESTTLVGVADRATTFPSTEIDGWVPLAHARQAAPPQWNMRGFRGFHAVARLRDGVTMASAAADLDGIARRLATEYPQFDDGVQTSIASLADRLAAPVKTALILLLVGAVLLLLVTCGSAATLSLSTAAAREHEWAIRVALGAGGRRLAAEALSEAAVLSCAGGACGLAGAQLLLRWFMHAHPEHFPRLDAIRLDVPVFLFTMLATAGAALITAAAPALRAAATAPASALKEARATGPRSRRTHRALVATQVALAVTLLLTTAALVRQLAAALSADLGAAHANALTTRVDMTAPAYARPDAQRAFMRRLLDELSAAGAHAALLSSLPPAAGQMRTTIAPVGGDRPTADVLVDVVAITPGSLEVLGVPLLEGRTVTSADTETAAPVAVLSASAARQLFPGRNAIGLRVPFGGGRAQPKVIGITGDVRYRGVDADAGAAMYLPVTQRSFRRMYAVVGSGRAPDVTARALLDAIHRADPSMAASEVKTLATLRGDAASGYTFRASIVGTIALAALLLAGVGIFGVTAQAAALRRRELALRMALGGRRSQVIRLIVGDTARLCALGGGAGAILAGAAQRLGGAYLALPRADVVTTVAAVVVTVGLGVVIAIAPAARAASADPSAVLRG